MSDLNPYAASSAYRPLEAELVDQRIDPQGDIWRDGSTLVVPRFGAKLPDRCVRCNAPAQGRRLRRRVYWCPKSLYVLILLGLPLFFILYIVLRKDATVWVGICRRHARMRDWSLVLGWLGSVASLATLLIGLLRFSQPDGAVLAGTGAVLFVLITTATVVLSRTVAPREIKKQRVWLQGVHPDYLQDFPDWPEW